MKQQAQAAQQEKRQAELQVWDTAAAGSRHSSKSSSGLEGNYDNVAETGRQARRQPCMCVYIADMVANHQYGFELMWNSRSGTSPQLALISASKQPAITVTRYMWRTRKQNFCILMQFMSLFSAAAAVG
jgi:hypothetical protein